jgi:tRNA U38,U39,U40 pseudouridine synthase TruA
MTHEMIFRYFDFAFSPILLHPSNHSFFTTHSLPSSCNTTNLQQINFYEVKKEFCYMITIELRGRSFQLHSLRETIFLFLLCFTTTHHLWSKSFLAFYLEQASSSSNARIKLLCYKWLCKGYEILIIDGKWGAERFKRQW